MSTGADASRQSTEARKQKVRVRIATQRERLRSRAEQRRQERAQTQTQAAALAAIPLVQRAVTFTKEHPWLVAATVVGAAVAGPARLVRWGSVALPLILKLRGR